MGFGLRGQNHEAVAETGLKQALRGGAVMPAILCLCAKGAFKARQGQRRARQLQRNSEVVKRGVARAVVHIGRRFERGIKRQTQRRFAAHIFKVTFGAGLCAVIRGLFGGGSQPKLRLDPAVLIGQGLRNGHGRAIVTARRFGRIPRGAGGGFAVAVAAQEPQGLGAQDQCGGIFGVAQQQGIGEFQRVLRVAGAHRLGGKLAHRRHIQRQRFGSCSRTRPQNCGANRQSQAKDCPPGHQL